MYMSVIHTYKVIITNMPKYKILHFPVINCLFFSYPIDVSYILQAHVGELGFFYCLTNLKTHT